MQIEPQLIGLVPLAIRLRVPVRWLKEQVRAGHLPCLRIGRRWFFDLPTVERALAARAARGEGVAR